MARVTVEDCILEIPNRFDLVMIAGQRARDISAGGQLTIDRDNDKNPVVALREIADKTVDLGNLQEALPPLRKPPTHWACRFSLRRKTARALVSRTLMKRSLDARGELKRLSSSLYWRFSPEPLFLSSGALNVAAQSARGHS